MLKVLLPLVALVSGGRCTSSELNLEDSPHLYSNWPCPDSTDIIPCVCATDGQLNLYMDCSYVNSEEQLAEIFQKDFPFSDFKLFSISRSNPSPQFQSLPAGVFGTATFQHIIIIGTYINTIQDGALVNSHGTLLILELQDNELTSFPFETLSLFTQLEHMNLAYNNLKTLPDIVSDSLRFLSLAGNLGLSLTTSTFGEAKMLEYLSLEDMLLRTIPHNVFGRLQHIHTLKMGKNGFSGTLIEKFISSPLNTLQVVDLHNNQIVDLHHMAISGLRTSATVNFRLNEIETLQQETWQDLLEQVGQDNVIDLRDNFLQCGCDVYWLVLNETLLMKIHHGTICKNGIYLQELPLDYFIENCPDGPEM